MGSLGPWTSMLELTPSEDPWGVKIVKDERGSVSFTDKCRSFQT